MTPLTHFGRAHFNFDRRLYLRSRLNWYLCGSLEKSGGHSFWALYGLLCTVNVELDLAASARRTNVGLIMLTTEPAEWLM